MEYSDRAKHRLRIAARFLRQEGFKFGDGNFYDLVMRRIELLDFEKKSELKIKTDWIEQYELAEKKNWDEQSRSRDFDFNFKTKFGKK